VDQLNLVTCHVIYFLFLFKKIKKKIFFSLKKKKKIGGGGGGAAWVERGLEWEAPNRAKHVL
jgi:hypothetical protein